MTVNYNKIKDTLQINYQSIAKDNRTYFVDEYGKIVASYDDNMIVMYFKVNENSETLFNHFGVAMATFIRDFQVNDMIADVLVLNGLCGAINDSTVIDNRIYNEINNSEIYQVFESESKANSETSDLFGSCGELSFNGEFAYINICDMLQIDDITFAKSEENYDYNVINFKHISSNAIYDDVYRYWREQNSWNYDQGYNNVSSPATRLWTENRKNSNISKDDVYFIGNPFKNLLDPIYEDTIIPFDIRIKKMRSILSNLVNPNQVDGIMKYYDTQDKSLDKEEDIIRK